MSALFSDRKELQCNVILHTDDMDNVLEQRQAVHIPLLHRLNGIWKNQHIRHDKHPVYKLSSSRGTFFLYFRSHVLKLPGIPDRPVGWFISDRVGGDKIDFFAPSSAKTGDTIGKAWKSWQAGKWKDLPWLAFLRTEGC